MPRTPVTGWTEREVRLYHGLANISSLQICALLLLPAIVSVYFVVGPADPWPLNHEHGTFLLRTRIFADHMRQGDLLPVWSSIDNHGLGSPLPLLYHKLYYLVAGSLAAFGLDDKTAVAWALIGFLWFGAVGMFVLLRRIDCSKIAATAGATYFIFANYTITDWLVRGAVAELAALALVPWLFWSFFVSLDQGRVIKRLGLFLALTFLCHSVIAFYAVIALALIGAFAVATRRMRLTASGVARSLWAVVVCLVVIAPYSGAMLLVRSSYDMRRLLAEPMLPVYQFRSLGHYFWDHNWLWGRTWHGLTTQLDMPLLVLYVGSLLLMLVLRSFPDRKRFLDAMVLFLLFAFGLILQMRWTNGFYTTVPGAEFIQFPWRLLAFMTPSLIALAMVTAEMASRRLGPWLCLVTCLIGIATAGVFKPVDYGDISEVSGAVVLSHNHVYQPVNAQYKDLNELLAAVDRQNCSVRSRTAESDLVTERLVRTYEVSCPAPGRVALPVYSAPGMSVSSTGRAPTDCLDEPGYTSLCAVEVTSGNTNISVAFPTLWSMLRSAFSPAS